MKPGLWSIGTSISKSCHCLSFILLVHKFVFIVHNSLKNNLKTLPLNKTASNIKINNFINLNILAHFDPNLSRITDAARECISLCRTLETFTTYIPPLRSSAFDTKLSMPSHKTERYESKSWKDIFRVLFLN